MVPSNLAVVGSIGGGGCVSVGGGGCVFVGGGGLVGEGGIGVLVGVGTGVGVGCGVASALHALRRRAIATNVVINIFLAFIFASFSGQ